MTYEENAATDDNPDKSGITSMFRQKWSQKKVPMGGLAEQPARQLGAVVAVVTQLGKAWQHLISCRRLRQHAIGICYHLRRLGRRQVKISRYFWATRIDVKQHHGHSECNNIQLENHELEEKNKSINADNFIGQRYGGFHKSGYPWIIYF